LRALTTIFLRFSRLTGIRRARGNEGILLPSPPMRRASLLILGTLAVASPAAAHPAPFSYVDVALGDRSVDLTVVAHVFDLAHDLEMDDPEDLLDAGVVAKRADTLSALLSPRLQIAADGRTLSCTSSDAPSVAPEQQSVRLRFACATAGAAGVVGVRTVMFPYDPKHQTFLNVYEQGALKAQAILDREHAAFEYFAGKRQGARAVAARFLPAGIHHILIGPDHLLFLVGLLLLGGSVRQLALVVTAFTLAHSLTLSLAVLGVVSPPSRIVEPAIALSIVYVGVDNLLVRQGRDLRAWIALAFGLIHGFGFAGVLREMELPRRALGLSLVSFNLGVEIGQLLVVVTVATALGALRARSEVVGRRLAVAGSIGVVGAGSFWFVQRLLFP
jgi:hydrogenase/urease accessory protein HupE